MKVLNWGSVSRVIHLPNLESSVVVEFFKLGDGED